MQLGWIDFSKEDRLKVLNVIELLSESGTLDELGIAPIRDGFADLFFPGTSVIQTRAKYFLIVPYAMDSIKRESNITSDSFLKKLDKLELECGKKLQDVAGAIGSRTIKSGGWVKRTPSDIYWVGLRKYGIFTYETYTRTEYIDTACKQSQERNKNGNRDVNDNERDQDDHDAGNPHTKPFWKLPKYPHDWFETLDMELTRTEAKFLKSQIESMQSGSMFTYILEKNLRNLTKLNEFRSLGELYKVFPSQMQADYEMALAFSEFIYGARIRYNVMISKNKNKLANQEWDLFFKDIVKRADIDIDAIFSRLWIKSSGQSMRLRTFLVNVKEHMLSKNISALDECIRKREVELKGESRSKLKRGDETDPDKWFGGGRLEYRFSNAMTIAKDIFQGLGA